MTSAAWSPARRFWARRGWPFAASPTAINRSWTTQTGVVAVCNGEIDNHRELRRWLAERGRPRGTRNRRGGDSRVCISNSARNSSTGSSARLPSPSGTRATGGSSWRAIGPGSARCFTRRAEARSFLPPSWPRWFRTAGCPSTLDQQRPAQVSAVRHFPVAAHAVRRNPQSRARRVDPSSTGRACAENRYWRWKMPETAKQRPSLDNIRRDLPRRGRAAERRGRGLRRLPERRPRFVAGFGGGAVAASARAHQGLHAAL